MLTIWVSVSEAIGCTFSYTATPLWPTSDGAVGPDTVVVGANIGVPGAWTITDASGAVVGATVRSLAYPGTGSAGDGAYSYNVVIPDAPLAPGTYAVHHSASTLDHTFEVADGLEAEPLAAPVPVWRVLANDLLYTDVCGSGDEIFVDRRMFRLCGDAVLYVVTAGDALPTATHVADSEGWAYDLDTLDLGDGGGDLGESATLWFAAMNGDGALSTWTGPDVSVLPEPQHMQIFDMPGAEGNASSTPTTFSTCPPYGEWVASELQYCASGTDCEPVSTSSANGEVLGCGCGHAGAQPSWLIGVLAASWLRGLRRRRE